MPRKSKVPKLSAEQAHHPRLTRTALTIVGLCLAGASSAKDYTASLLLRDCSALQKMVQEGKKTENVDQAFRMGVCTGFIAGTLAEAKVYEMDMVRNKVTPESCPYGGSIGGPGQSIEEVGPDQMRRIVLLYLESHPKDLNLPASIVFRKILADAYPCTDLAMKRTQRAYTDRTLSRWAEKEGTLTPTP